MYYGILPLTKLLHLIPKVHISNWETQSQAKSFQTSPLSTASRLVHLAKHDFLEDVIERECTCSGDAAVQHGGTLDSEFQENHQAKYLQGRDSPKDIRTGTSHQCRRAFLCDDLTKGVDRILVLCRGRRRTAGGRGVADGHHHPATNGVERVPERRESARDWWSATMRRCTAISELRQETHAASPASVTLPKPTTKLAAGLPLRF